MKFFWGVLAGLVSISAQAVDTSPIQVRNSLPIIEGAGFGAPKSATLNETGIFAFNLNANIESHANDSGSGFNRDDESIDSETLILDGEVHSLTLDADWGFAPNWQASIGIKGVRNTAGQFDSAIDAWHDLFSLDDGDRARQAEDQLLFLYDGRNNSAQIDQANAGLGDVQLGVSRQLITNSNLKLAVHSELNLPNGKRREALGSTKTDVSFSLAAAGYAKTLGWHTNIGLLVLGDDTLFAVPTKASTWFTSVGAHWQAGERWRWSAQLDGHGAVFDSAIKELSQTAWQLALAGEWQVRGAALQLYFTEDISVNSAADFSFGLNIKFYRR